MPETNICQHASDGELVGTRGATMLWASAWTMHACHRVPPLVCERALAGCCTLATQLSIPLLGCMEGACPGTAAVQHHHARGDKQACQQATAGSMDCMAGEQPLAN